MSKEEWSSGVAHGARQPGCRTICALLVLCAVLWGCDGDCRQVRGQLAAFVVDCAQPGQRYLSIHDCSCECTASLIEDWAQAAGCVWRVVIAPPEAGGCVWTIEVNVGDEPPWPTATPDPLVTRVASADATLRAVETIAAGLLETIGAEGNCCADLTLTAAAPTPAASWTPESTAAPVDPDVMCRLCVESVDCGEGYTCADCAGAWRCVRVYFPRSDCANYCEGG